MTAEGGGWAGGKGQFPAAQLALQHVNADSDLLPDYRLVMHHNDSGCQPGQGLKAMYDHLYTGPTKVMLMSGCSLVTTHVAEAVHMWNLIVLSYGASSPALSNRKRFPTLFRTHPSANLQNPTRVKLFNLYNWRKIAVVQSAEEVFTSTAKNLERECGKEISVSRLTFMNDPSDALQSLKKHDARIIVGFFYESDARKVFCQAYKLGLYGPKYVWFIIGWYKDNWFKPVPGEGLNCTEEQMRIAVEKHITTESEMWDLSPSPPQRDTVVPKGLIKSTKFRTLLIDLLNTTEHDAPQIDGFVEAPLAYDAIWVVALVLNRTISKLRNLNVKIENFDYSDTRTLRIMQEAMSDINMRGVSGDVAFNKEGDRVMKIKIEQMINGTYYVNGYYTSQTKDWTDGARTIEFFNTRPPLDSPQIIDKFMATQQTIYIGAIIIMVFGLSAATASLIFNYENSNRKYIEQSQPQCNALVLLGCFLSLISITLWGLPTDSLLIDESKWSTLCLSRIALVVWGFTCGFGTLFAKVLMVRRFGSSEHHPTMKKRLANKPVPAFQFNIIVGTMLVIDTIILFAWMEFDPMQRVEKIFPLRMKPELDQQERPVLHTCHSINGHIYTGVILVYKGLTILLALFFGIESRCLRLRYVNDSRFVALSIYNVAALVLLTAPVILFLIDDESTNARFIFTSATIITCTLVTIGLLFIPKVIYIWKNPMTKKEKPSTAPVLGKDKMSTEATEHRTSNSKGVERSTVEAEITTANDESDENGAQSTTETGQSSQLIALNTILGNSNTSAQLTNAAAVIRKWTASTFNNPSQSTKSGQLRRLEELNAHIDRLRKLIEQKEARVGDLRRRLTTKRVEKGITSTMSFDMVASVDQSPTYQSIIVHQQAVPLDICDNVITKRLDSRCSSLDEQSDDIML